MSHGKKERMFVRLTKSQRIQHAILFVSTGLLILTGFMLMGERWVIEMFGSAGNEIFYWRGIIHRVAGVAVTLVCLYHLGYVVLQEEGRSWIKDMLPCMGDATHASQNVSYMLGFREVRPKMERFTYLEKLEYFSVLKQQQQNQLPGSGFLTTRNTAPSRLPHWHRHLICYGNLTQVS